ncbi:hypothetical protein LPJ74_001016 [Coemansia sp. RSA 1843]|nr:hypothetical protein LPJ74_001016 [Coemansia sp. RSA 1843]
MSNKAAPLANIDSAELELLLSRKLQDPTPTVLRKDVVSSTYETPPKYTPSSHAKHQMTPLQIGSVFPGPTPFPDLPQRKESSVYKHKLLAKPNFAEHQLMQNKLPLAATQQMGRSKDRSVHVVRELVSTEKTFVSDIEALVSVFAAPLCDYARSKQVLLDDMLHPLQMLLIFQRRFLQLLADIADTNVFAIAQLFASEISGFRIYVGYSIAFHRINKMLGKFEADSAWQKLVARAQAQVSHYPGQCKLGLRDLLIRPVQRICKYPLFLSELLKHTAKESETYTHAELSRSLSLIKGVCVAIDKEQHRSEDILLYNAILSSYCDNQKLPASFVARLGMISLSGLLRIHSSGTDPSSTAELVGCVLFKRFIIIFTFGKPRHLVPQYWFPMHTMALVDEGTEYKYFWQLRHLKSGQYMRFSARSARERDLWLRKLMEAISMSIAKIPQPRAGGYGTDRMLPQPEPILQDQQRRDGIPAKSHISKSLGRGQNNKLFWYGSSSHTREREREFELFFKSMTSPEIIRINTLEKLHSTHVPAMTKTEETQPAPQLPVPSLHSAISPSFSKAPSQWHTKSCDSGDCCVKHDSSKAEAATSSEITGILYLQSPCQFQQKSYSAYNFYYHTNA